MWLPVYMPYIKIYEKSIYYSMRIKDKLILPNTILDYSVRRHLREKNR